MRFSAELLNRAVSAQAFSIDSLSLSLITASDGQKDRQKDGQSAAPLPADSPVTAAQDPFNLMLTQIFSTVLMKPFDNRKMPLITPHTAGQIWLRNDGRCVYREQLCSLLEKK